MILGFSLPCLTDLKIATFGFAARVVYLGTHSSLGPFRLVPAGRVSNCSTQIRIAKWLLHRYTQYSDSVHARVEDTAASTESVRVRPHVRDFSVWEELKDAQPQPGL